MSPSAVVPGSPPTSLPTARQQLRQTHLFAALADADLDELARACSPREARAGEVVVAEGDAGDAMYMVVAGKLEVFQRDAGGREVRLGVVHKGEHFGEAALLDDARRMATVRALEPCRLLSLSRAHLAAFCERDPALRASLLASLELRVQWARARQFRPARATVMGVLADATGATDARALEALEEEVEWVTLPRGDRLITQGEPGDCMFVVVSGRLRVFAGWGDQDTSIAEIGPGETVGEMALLSDEPRSAHVEALRDTELLRLSKAGFQQLVEAHPRLMARVARTMVERLSRGIRARSAVTQLRAAPLATPQDCAGIARTDNLVLRNLKITQMYHRLSLEMTLLIGHQDANWCTFACNASKTAGYAIRREELPLYDVLAPMLRRRPRIGRAIARAQGTFDRIGLRARVDDMLDDVSRCISEGNLKVFAEIAPIFAGFIGRFHDAVEYDRTELEAFVRTLKPGPTPAGGQDLLAEAMTHYHDAMFERAPKRKAELILLANAKVGLHEQQRLQPNIVEGLDAPIRAGLGGVLGRAATAPLRRVLPRRVGAAIEAAMNAQERALLARATSVWRRMVTRRMMTLRLPYGKVRLGRDMPRLPNDELFPDVLQQLELPELVALVREYDYTADTLTGSGASDWGNLADRMNFILDLFRSRQKSLELFDQPFLYQQRLDMTANRVPVGRL